MEAKTAALPSVEEWGSRSHVQTIVLTSLTAVGLYLCYRLAMPFLPALAWALALAVVFSPLQRWLETKLRRPNLAAGVCVVAIGLIVVVPVAFVSQHLVQEALRGAEFVKAKVESGEWRQALEAHPRLAPVADWLDRQNLPGTALTVATWMTSSGASIVHGSIVEVLGIVLTFYLLFFLLRDRRVALRLLRSLSPLSTAEMDELGARVGDTIHATVYGTLAVAAVQGLLGGLMFWWLGLPSPLLWGTIMGLLAVVPVLGAFVVWLPAAVYLGLTGSLEKAAALSLWGMFVVGTVDNFLRPVLVGKRLRLHTVFAFISVVGGLMLFGAAGVILGPVVLTLTAELLAIWRGRSVPAPRELPEADALERFENEGGRVAPDARPRSA
ncbi:MAG: AI-2E family transporter [Planctomycetes bacterium]|nr:AI-2E family transporter [Planctomycetota bacterium]